MDVIAQTTETSEVRGGSITFIVVNMAGRGGLKGECEGLPQRVKGI